MKLHKPVDMRCKSINTIFHDRESIVHILSEIANIQLDNVKPPVYLLKSFVYPLESFIYLLKSFVYLLKSFVYLLKSFVYLLK
ncbi:MAG TPA: hypothetical protein VMO00_16295, partial [Methylomirabilota bacterium]|nr:hypothetical protein [Methylomirabilota bacterium]